MGTHSRHRDPRRHSARTGRRSRRSRYRSVDALAQNAIDDDLVPGLAVGAVVDGELVFARGYGLADLEEEVEMPHDAVFQLASVSKTVTAVALMQVYASHDFELDDPINPWLDFEVHHPEHPHVPITFRQLLTHTSSIEDDWDVLESYYVFDEDNTVELGAFLIDYLTEDGEDYSEGDNFGAGRPGSASAYSNVATALVGYLVEAITGVDFADWCHEHIFDPLGMDDTTWHVGNIDHDAQQVAWPYGWDDDEEAYTSRGLYSTPDYPDGQLLSTVPDMARLIIGLMGWGDTDPLLDEDLRTMMFTPQVADLDPNQGLIWYWKRFEDVDVSLVGHEGAETGISTCLWVHPEARFAALVFLNGEEGDEEICDDVVEALLEAHGLG